jgi:serine/threonine protein kinase
MHTACGLAHLDIKLENVMLDDQYNPKLIDFAYSDDISKKLTIFRGTEFYMAPEIF